jgi:hypothetical protein
VGHELFSLEDEVIGSDVGDLANVWMVDRGNGARFALKPAHIVCDHPLDRERTIQAFIVRFVGGSEGDARSGTGNSLP